MVLASPAGGRGFAADSPPARGKVPSPVGEGRGSGGGAKRVALLGQRIAAWWSSLLWKSSPSGRVVFFHIEGTIHLRVRTVVSLSRRRERRAAAAGGGAERVQERSAKPPPFHLEVTDHLAGWLLAACCLMLASGGGAERVALLGPRIADSCCLLRVAGVSSLFCVTPGRYVQVMETEATIDQLEQLLVDDEAHIARLRARQMVALQALDIAQVALMDGSRTLCEWVAARLDLTPETAQKLTQTAQRLDRPALPGGRAGGGAGHLRSGSRRVPPGFLGGFF